MPVRLRVSPWPLALCLMASAALQAAPVQVPEAPAPVMRTGLELPDRYATTYGWLDDRYLAVTTPPKGDTDSYSGLRRVVVVDSRTSAQKTLLEQGFLSCTNPHTGVVAAYVGDLRKMYRGGNSPDPVLTWFHWDAQRVQLEARPLAKGQTLHAEQCRAYEPEEDRNGQVATGAAPVRYLEPGHGQIRWRNDLATQKRTDVRWERGNQRRTLDVPADEIAAFVDWMPYRSAYLLSAGIYDDIHGQQRELLALTTMDLQGRVARQPLPADARKTLKRLQANQAFVAPVRDGLLVMVHGRSDDGAGLYRYSQKGLQRLFCARPPGLPPGDDFAPRDYCFLGEPFRISPDGCRLAFATRHDFDGRGSSKGMAGQVHVLELCNRPAR